MNFDEINEENIDGIMAQASNNAELQAALIQYHFQVKNDVSEGANMLFNYLFANPIGRFSEVSNYMAEREVSQKAEIFSYFNGRDDDFSKTAQGFLNYIGCGVAQSLQEAHNFYVAACSEILNARQESEEEPEETFEMGVSPVALVMSGLLFEHSNIALVDGTSNIHVAIKFYQLAEENGFALPEGYIATLQNQAINDSPFELINDNVVNERPINDVPVDDVTEVVSSSYVVPATPQLESPRKKARKIQRELNGSVDELCREISRKNETLQAQESKIVTLTNENLWLNQENINLKTSLTEKNSNIDALQAEVNRLTEIVGTNKKEQEKDAIFFAELAKRIEKVKRTEVLRVSSSDEDNAQEAANERRIVPLLPSNPLKRQERPKGSSDEDSLSDSEKKRQKQH